MRKLCAPAQLALIRQFVWRLTVKDSFMADAPASNVAVVNTAKVAGNLALLPILFSSLPQNIALPICITMVTCAGIIASVPAPTNHRVLIALYQLVRVVGLGVGYALPYVATHLGKGGSVAQPVAASGADPISTPSKDITK